MSYNFNSIPTVPPAGAIAPYVGTTDPPGWAICNGQSRSNTSGLYNNLVNSGLINQISYTINASSASGTSTAYLPATYTFYQIATTLNGQLILAGNNSAGYLYLSTNKGSTWTIQLNTLSANWSTASISATNGQFMLAGNNSLLYLSTNTGTNWQQISGPTFGSTYGLFTTTANWSSSAISNTGQYLLAGMNNGNLYLSTNSGAKWTILGGAANANGMPTSAVLWSSCSMNASGSLMAASVNVGGVYLSTNSGTNWSTAPTLSTSSPWSNVAVSSIANYLVASGNSENIYLSTDGAGATWSQKSALPVSPVIVAVGQGTNTIAYSSDGTNFTGLGTTVFTSTGNAVASNGSRWVAVGSGGCSIAYSDNGINWTKADSGSLKFSTGGLCVFWDGTRWLAGGSGTNYIAYSTDGANWTTLTTSSALPNPVRGIASNGTMWIAVGGNNNSSPTAVRSIDFGTTWQQITSVQMTYIWGINYKNSVWIMGSNSTLNYYSTNGYTWTASTKGTGFVDYNGYAANYNNGLWVGCYQAASSNSLGYSTNNGVSWISTSSNSGSVLTDRALFVGWCGNKWIAVGYGGNTIASSPDGITWTGLGSSIFSTYGNGVAWNGLVGGATNGLPATAQAWQSLAISGDGTKLIAGTNASSIYASTTSGNTWITLGGAYNTVGLPNSATSNWSSMAISQDGNTWLADVNGAQMYISADGLGKQWAIKASYSVLGTGTWQTVTISSDATTVVAGSASSYLYVSYDAGNTYNALTSNGNLSGTKNWSGSAISQNNQIMFAAAYGDFVYLSLDTGLTWTSSLNQTTYNVLIGLPTVASNWKTVSIDSTGKYLIAGINSGIIYLSSSFGVTWTSIGGTTNSTGLPTTFTAWNTSAISGNSQFMLAGVTNGSLYLSTNTGLSWINISNVSYGLPTSALAWQTTSISTTGQYMLAGTNNTALYLSTNSGSYWAVISGAAYGSSYGQGLPITASGFYTSAISSTGQYMATGIYGGALYFSNNNGLNWMVYTSSPLSTTLNWQSMGMSSSGKYLIAGINSGNVYNITTQVVPTATYTPPQINSTTNNGTTLNYIIKL